MEADAEERPTLTEDTKELLGPLGNLSLGTRRQTVSDGAFELRKLGLTSAKEKINSLKTMGLKCSRENELSAGLCLGV